MNHLKLYNPPNPQIYTKYREDEPFGARFSHVVKCIDMTNSSHLEMIQQYKHIHPSKKSIAIVGFCSDEGVKRNFGRVGAREGPSAIRQALKGFPIHESNVEIFDCGDIALDNELEQGQSELGLLTKELDKYVDVVFVLGGGHEVAYGHYLGQWDKDTVPPAIFNFDAHFDLRKMSHASSGTPFLQIHDLCKSHDQEFVYHVFGIQSASNTKVLYDTAHDLKVNYMETEAILDSNIQQISKNFLSPFIEKNNQIYVTICLDVFNGGCAPGVSAVNGYGLQPHHVIKVLRELIRSRKVKHIDIAELNPKYDVQSLTAKLAALLFYVSMEELAKME